MSITWLSSKRFTQKKVCTNLHCTKVLRMNLQAEVPRVYKDACSGLEIERSRVRIPAGAEEFSFPGSTFCADSYFGIQPRVTAVARKRPRSFCQKCWLQVTAKHACTLRMWLRMKWHSAWLYGVHKTRRDGSSFMWHQPCQRRKYTIKRATKSYSLM